MAGFAERASDNLLAALLMAPGTRPDAARVEADASSGTGSFAVSHRAPGEPGWIELLRDGLTFDVLGLAPGSSVAMPAGPVSSIGLPEGVDLAMLEALGVAPGPHLVGAEHLLPVVRVAVQLITYLAAKYVAKAVLWKPSGSAVSPDWFSTACNAWLAGGPFPALAMTSFARTGSDMTSRGLAFLIGQEFRLYSSGGILQEKDARVSVRLVDWLVAHGRVDEPREAVLPGVGAVWLEPGADGIIHARSA